MSPDQKPPTRLPIGGVLSLSFLCLLWGANIVSIKVSNQGISPILAATVRSIVASILLWGYATTLRESVFLPAGLTKHGVAVGFLFGVEFLFLYWGFQFTDASRAVIFLYTQPVWTAVLAHLLLPDDRLGLSKAAGVILAVAGLCLVFGSNPGQLGSTHWVGDLMEVAAGFLWAATTIYIKRFVWNTSITHFQTLFSQLSFSIPVLCLGFVLLEWDAPVSLTPPVVAALFYQTVIVAFASYLGWFWLLHRYQASRLSAFTFLTPLFGVILSGLLLGEPLTLYLWMGLGLVAVGIYLVNRG